MITSLRMQVSECRGIIFISDFKFVLVNITENMSRGGYLSERHMNTSKHFDQFFSKNKQGHFTWYKSHRPKLMVIGKWDKRRHDQRKTN